MDQEQRKRDRRSKLTEEDVAQIKAHLQQGKNPAILARYFQASRSTIYDIRATRRWRRVTPAAGQRLYRNYIRQEAEYEPRP